MLIHCKGVYLQVSVVGFFISLFGHGKFSILSEFAFNYGVQS